MFASIANGFNEIIVSVPLPYLTSRRFKTLNGKLFRTRWCMAFFRKKSTRAERQALGPVKYEQRRSGDSSGNGNAAKKLATSTTFIVQYNCRNRNI
jgi:hypothetical protein